MICTKCGSKFPDGSAKCQWCGEPTPANTVQPTEVAAGAATPPALPADIPAPTAPLLPTAAQPLPTPQSPAPRYNCPFCEYQGPPIVSKQLSSNGWILFAVLLLVCVPLCWLPFVLDGCKEEIRKCAGCGARLGDEVKVDED